MHLRPEESLHRHRSPAPRRTEKVRLFCVSEQGAENSREDFYKKLEKTVKKGYYIYGKG